MTSRVESSIPEPGLLNTNHWTFGPTPSRPLPLVWRPKGAKDWLLIYTEHGEGRVAISEGIFRPLKAGDILLFRPGIPQEYGLNVDQPVWRHVWVHFTPRPEWVNLLNWPEINPGVHLLQIPEVVRPDLMECFLFMNTKAKAVARRRQDFLMNAFEKALLVCDSVNPKATDSKHDARIQKSVEYICQNIESKFSIAELAKVAGISRSRFAFLFHQHTGMTPANFIELERIYRAKQLLEFTHYSLAEISTQLGFSSPFYLSLRFKKHLGMNPRECRKKASRGST